MEKRRIFWPMVVSKLVNILNLEAMDRRIIASFASKNLAFIIVTLEEM